MRRSLVRLASAAVVLAIASGAFYTAFAQANSVGSFQDSACAYAQGQFLPGQANLLFEGTATSGYNGVIAGGGTTITVSLSASSTCYLFSNPQAGVYTAYIVSGSGISATTFSSALFTETPYIVEAYQGSLCQVPLDTYTQGNDAFLLVEGQSGYEYLVVAGPGSTASQFISTQSSCAAYSPAAMGTYTAFVLSANSGGTAGATEGSTTFLIVSNTLTTISFYNDPACVTASTATFGTDTTPYVLFGAPIFQNEQVHWVILTGGATMVDVVNFAGSTSGGPTTVGSCVAALTTIGSTSPAATQTLPAGTYTALIASGTGSPFITSTSAFFTISNSVPLLPYGFAPLAAAMLVAYIFLGRKVRSRVRAEDRGS